MARDQGQGFGGGENPAQPQAIGQPVTVGQQQLRGLPVLPWGDRIGGPQPPALSQAEASQGSPLAGLQLAAAGQLGRFISGDGFGFEQGPILGGLDIGGDLAQLLMELGRVLCVGLRPLGLQLPAFGLQQPGQGGAVRVALGVAVGPQLGPCLQPGPIGPGRFQHPQQRIGHGP